MTEVTIPQVITVLLEYNPEQERVFVRRASKLPRKPLEPLAAGNVQNYVKVFDGVDMKWHAGFTFMKENGGGKC